MKTAIIKIRKTLGQILVGLTLVGLLASCGGDDNNVNSDQVASPTPHPTNPGPTTPLPVNGMTPTQINKINQVKAQHACNLGSRLPDAFFNTSSMTGVGGNQTNVFGPFQPGAMPGPVSQIYIGRSFYNDLIIVTKVVSANGQVQGFNVAMSMCEYPNLIRVGMQLTNFQAPKGIIIDDDKSCAIGSVDKASNTYLQGQIANDPQIPGISNIITTFAPVGGLSCSL